MNRSGIRTTVGNAKRDILFCTDPVVAISVRVNSTGITDTDNLGRKVILAGTALSSASNPLTDRQTELSSVTAGQDIYGVTQHNIYFWPEDEFATANANMIIFGFIDTNKLEDGAKPSQGTIDALKNKVTFINGK